MARKKTKGPQQFAAPIFGAVPQVSFNVNLQDNFITSHSVELEHYKAIPSPIGKKLKGDYRRSDELDTVSSNGYIYKCAGSFSAVMLGNNRGRGDGDGGFFDTSSARLTFPRFYNAPGTKGESDGERIYLAPGDRVYVKNKDIDTRVPNYQEVQYDPNKDDILQFPAVKVEYLIDSRNIEYECGLDFKITEQGNIRWLPKGRNPGIDTETGKGRVYSIRYLYTAHWYIVSLINEVRIGRVTENGKRQESRFPYHASIVREYVYHNRNNAQEVIGDKKEDIPRAQREPQERVNKGPFVKVNMDDIEDLDD